jgi:hypothetical protein
MCHLLFLIYGSYDTRQISSPIRAKNKEQRTKIGWDDQEKASPHNQGLYDTIVYLDSIFFNAYNTCDMELQAEF